MRETMFPPKNSVKITVIRKLFHKDLVEKYTDKGNWTQCSHFEIGQEFRASEAKPWGMPDGFCGWAWADIQKIVWGMARGGPNVFVTCCTDGYRPVVFLLEKAAEEGDASGGG